MQLSIGARAQGWSDGGHSVADCHAAHDTGNRHSRTRMAGKTNPAAAGCTVAFGNDLRHSGALSAAPVAEPGQPEHQQRGGPGSGTCHTPSVPASFGICEANDWMVQLPLANDVKVNLNRSLSATTFVHDQAATS
ncbi:MAG: hypothetical protein H6962_13830 [Chromatiaceae bacterium]|nr:hypothetical protein [Chromatiaceae bacterium]